MRTIFIALLTLVFSTLSAQKASKEDSLPFFDMSLDELLNVKIDANNSGKNKLFRSNNSYVLLKKEIKRSGAKNIPEALRLIPGVIVQETTAGNYLVGINFLNNSFLFSNNLENNSVLLLIDDVVQNDALSGDIFWESVNVSISDLEAIEVYYGPSGIVFDETSVSGVIRLVTKHTKGTDEVQVKSYVSTNKDASFNSFCKVTKGKLAFSFSANLDYRRRYGEDYYYFYYNEERYIPNLDNLQPDVFIPSYKSLFPLNNSAKRKEGLKAGISYDLPKDWQLQYNIGYVNSFAVKNRLLLGVSPLTLSPWQSEALHQKITVANKNLNVQAVYQTNVRDMFTGLKILSNKYKEEVAGVYANYSLGLLPGFYLRPNVSMKSIIIDDREYTQDKIGLLNRRTQMHVLYTGVDIDWNYFEKIRLLSSFKLNRNSFQKKFHPSYTLELDYNPDEKHQFQLVYGKSNKRNPILLSQIDFPMDSWRYTYNRDLKPYISESVRLNYNWNWTGASALKIGLYAEKGRNYTYLKVFPEEKEISYSNSEMVSTQYGLTLSSFNSFFKNKLKLSAFVTFAFSRWDHFCPNLFMESPTCFTDDIQPNTTPDYYGGVSASLDLLKNLTLSLNSYFYGAYNYYTILERPVMNDSNDHTLFLNTMPSGISSDLVMDVVVQYAFKNNFTLYVSGNNLFGNTRQVYSGDKITSLYFLGLQLKY